MDLRHLDAEPSGIEAAAVDAVLGPPESGWSGGERSSADEHFAAGGHAARSDRHLLLPALHAVNDRMGWISPGALGYICRRLTVPPAEAYGVATFYALFSLEPRPGVVAHVCVDLACMVNGSADLCARLEAAWGDAGHQSNGQGPASVWLRSPCLGLCEQAPAALVTVAGAPARHTPVAPATFEAIDDAKTGRTDLHHTANRPTLASGPLLRRVGGVDPDSLSQYVSADGYAALRLAYELGPEGVIREVVDSKLLGRGGAAFPTGRKWDAVARQPVRPHFLVCNADESEPGTFKDRVLMEGDPYSIVESMTIAAYATGCDRGYVYLRGEYPVAWQRLAHAIETARRKGLLGADIMGKGQSFDIEMRKGAGAYICGEETAIFNSIEGFRGEPRNKPPFPVESGLFGLPTLVNNVETLVNVAPILLRGGADFAAIGTEASTGTKLFGVSGRVARPGVCEVPFGTTLGQVVEQAGGLLTGHELRAILLGGAAGTFLGPDKLDTPLTFEGTRTVGASLGSGVVMVLDETVDLVPFLLRIAAFFRDESCGQCVPCRVGTVRQEEALHRLAAGPSRKAVLADLDLLDEVGRAMRDASICGLGQTAYNAIDSAFATLGVFR